MTNVPSTNYINYIVIDLSSGGMVFNYWADSPVRWSLLADHYHGWSLGDRKVGNCLMVISKLEKGPDVIEGVSISSSNGLNVHHINGDIWVSLEESLGPIGSRRGHDSESSPY